MVTVDGTTSRNRMPDAATASQITRMVSRMTMRSRVTGLSHGPRSRAGARVRCPV